MGGRYEKKRHRTYRTRRDGHDGKLPVLDEVCCRQCAEDGVGATIAPKSHVENGSCADLVSAANAMHAMGIMA